MGGDRFPLQEMKLFVSAEVIAMDLMQLRTILTLSQGHPTSYDQWSENTIDWVIHTRRQDVNTRNLQNLCRPVNSPVSGGRKEADFPQHSVTFTSGLIKHDTECHKTAKK